MVEDVEFSSSLDPTKVPIVAAAKNAVKQIGTNAIPFLLKKTAARETPLGKRFKSLLDKQSLIHFHFADLQGEQGLAELGFEILGKDAMSAVPALVALTDDPDSQVRFSAFIDLVVIRPGKEIMMPILLRWLKHPDLSTRQHAASLLHRLYPEEEEKAEIYKVLPSSKHTNAPAVQ